MKRKKKCWVTGVTGTGAAGEMEKKKKENEEKKFLRTGGQVDEPKVQGVPEKTLL